VKKSIEHLYGSIQLVKGNKMTCIINYDKSETIITFVVSYNFWIFQHFPCFFRLKFPVIETVPFDLVNHFLNWCQRNNIIILALVNHDFHSLEQKFDLWEKIECDIIAESFIYRLIVIIKADFWWNIELFLKIFILKKCLIGVRTIIAIIVLKI
jgi:hypothetical protein